MKRTFPAVLLLFVLSGCALFDPLPSGTPPDGAIVQNRRRIDFDESSAVNYMTTSLSIFLLTDPPPENQLFADTDQETEKYAHLVIAELSKITGVKESSTPGGQVLRTRGSLGKWHFQLLRDGRTVWQETLDLGLCRKTDQ